MPVPDFSPGEVLTASAMDSIGLWLVSSTNFTNQATVQINSTFPTSYSRFRILITTRSTVQAARWLGLRLSVGGTPAISNYFAKSVWWYTSNSNLGADNGVQRTDLIPLGPLGGSSSPSFGFHVVDITNVNIANQTQIALSGSGAWETVAPTYFTGGGVNTNNTIYDGITLIPSSDNITGNVKVYGYRN